MNGPPCCALCGRHPPPVGFAWCMRCTNDRLKQHAEALVERLLPNGQRRGRYWEVGSVAGEPGNSLKVDLGLGRDRGRWRDWASVERGDLLDLIRIVVCGGNNLAAMGYAADILRAPPPAPPGAAARARRRERTPEESARDALKIWRAARPLQRGDLVWRYFLDARGIDLALLPRIPSLRFHRALWHSEAKRTFPGMVAAIITPDGAPAIHRAWLLVQNGVVDKAPVYPPRMALGEYAGGFIPLVRGSTGRPWHNPEPGECLGISEGVEDGLSAVLEQPWRRDGLSGFLARPWRIVAAVSLSNMLSMLLPAAIAEVILLEQNDPPGSKAAKTLEAVERYFQRSGKEVQRLLPANPAVKDLNDVLRQHLRRRLAGTKGGL
jgi:hypothetical protein